MNLNQIPLKNNKRILARKLENALLLVFADTDSAYLLEGPIVLVWNLINGKRTIKDIISKFSEEYAGARQKITKYVVNAMHELTRINAIHFKQ